MEVRHGCHAKSPWRRDRPGARMQRKDGHWDASASGPSGGRGSHSLFCGDDRTGQRPTIGGHQFFKRRLGTVGVLSEHISAGPGDIKKGDPAFKEQANSGLVRRVEHGAAGASMPSDFITQIKGRKGFAVRLLEMQSAER